MKNIKFFKKFAAVALGFVMTLGVGAAGYASSASSASAVNSKDYSIVPDASTTGASGTSYKTSNVSKAVNGTTFIWNNFMPNSAQIRVNQGNVTSLSASNFYVYNNTETTYPIKSISITFNGSVTANYFQVYTGDSALTSNQNFDTKHAGSLSSSVMTWEFTGTQKYFRLGCAKNGGTVKITAFTVHCEEYVAPSSTYTVKFNAGSGIGSMDDETVDITKSFTIPDGSDFSKDGYEFVDWLGSDSVHYSAGSTIPANTFSKGDELTLTAQWKQEDPNLCITINNFTEITTSYTSLYTHSYSVNGQNVSVDAYGVYKNTDGIQMNKGKDTYIKNTSALGVKITKIVCNWKAAGANSPTIYVSESSEASASSTSLGKGSSSETTQTFTVTDANKNFQYFYFDGSTVTGACYLTELKIYYAPMVVHTVTVSGNSEVYVGKTIDLTASCDQGDSITGWLSSDTGKATVSNGTVTGKAAGTVTITATASCGKTGTKTITVKADVKTLESIVVGGSKQTAFYPGDKFAFGGTVTGTYSHSNGDPNSTETISSGYTFKIDGSAATVGTTTLTEGTHSVVVSYGGKSADAYSISVAYDDPESISVAPEATMGPGDELTLTPVVNPSTANPAVDYDYDVDGDLVDEVDFTFDNGSISIDESNVNFGTITVTVYSHVDDSVYAECVITVLGVKAPEIVGIDYNITGSYKAEQYVNKQPVDLTGIEFYAIYDNEETAAILASDIEWDDTLDVGDNPYGIYVDPVTGNDFDIEIPEITIIADSLASISINTPATLSKPDYVVGESWSNAGLSISGLMASGDSAAASLLSGVTYTFSPASPSVGLTSVSVTAHVGTLNSPAVSANCTVVAQALTSISLDTQPTKKSYKLGEDLDLSGMVLTAHYNLSSLDHPMNSSEYTVEGYDKFTVSQSQTVTLKSTVNPNFTQTFTVDVHAVVTESAWKKVTSEKADWSGTYLIVYEPADSTKGNAFTGVDAASDYVEGDLSNGNITYVDGMAKVEIGSISGGYSLKITNGDKAGNYISGKSGSNTIVYGADAVANTITFADGAVTIESNSASLRYNKASGNNRFRFYKTSTTGADYVVPSLYEEVQGEAASLIRITAVCNKTGIIAAGTTLEKSDFTVTGLYNDGQSKTLELSEFNATGLTLNNVGDNVVTISADGVDDCEVHVTAVEATFYDLVLMDGDSQYGETISAAKGQSVNLPTLTKAGSTFNGWSDGTTTFTGSYTMPEHDVTLTAVWTADVYKVTYVSDTCTGDIPVDSTEYHYGDTVEVAESELSIQYMTFGGWSDGNGHTYKAGDTFTIQENVTLTAVWEHNYVEITFDKNGGTGTNPQKVSMYQGSDYVKVKDPSDDFKAGHPFGTHFAGWNTQADGFGTHYDVGATIPNILSDLKLYAEWKVDDFPSTDLDATLVCSELGLENGADGSGDFAIGTIATATFADGSVYYTTGPGIRVYAGKTFTVTSKSGNISKIEIAYGTGTDANAVTPDSGTLSDGYTVWTPGEESTGKVVFTVGGTSKNRRIKSIKVYIAGSGQDIPEDATIVENLSGVGTENPIVLNDGTTVTGLIHEHGLLFEGESVSFAAEHGKVITYASVYMLYDYGYDLEYSNDYGATWDYNPFAKVTRAKRAEGAGTEVGDLKDTNAVRFTLNDPDSEAEKDILKCFKVTTSFGTNSNMTVDYNWEKNGSQYTIDVTKAYARFAIDVDEDFNKYFTEKDQYGKDYWIGFAYSTTGGNVIVDDHLATGVSTVQYTKGEMPANNEFGLKLNCLSNLKQDKTVALIVKDSEGNLVEFSKQKTASFEDVFYAYFTDDVIASLNAEELAVYNTLLAMLGE